MVFYYIWKNHAFNRTIFESMSSYISYREWKDEGGQTYAALKRIIPNVKHTTIWHVNGFKVRTTIERFSFYACNKTKNVNGSKATTTHVFTNWYISTTYALNGRKVTIKILRGTNIM